MDKKKPASVVIGLFGVRPLARQLKLSPGAVSKWQERGLVPSKHHERLLELAKEMRKKLTAQMLVVGS